MSRTPLSAQSTKRALSALAQWLVVAAALSGALSFSGPKTPAFADHQINRVYREPVKPPDFGNPEQYSGTDLRCFGVGPELYSAMPVNFAGHFVLTTCSCGSGCHYLFLWDAENGKVYRDFPFGAINVGPYRSAVGRPQVKYEGEQYRPDSKLLVLDACFEGTCDCAKRYYLWDALHFKLIFKEQDRLPPACGHR
jgi:hypothetical protein